MTDRKRYQIFVSSTYEDLKNERAKVMETILNFDCFPAGMERFPAMDVKLFEYIKKIIDDSDYYLLIIGGRYGSVDKSSGKSWTEQEFDYAVSRGIPIMVFDHQDFTMLPAYKTDQDDEKRNKLLEFREKAKTGRHFNKWSSADNLALKVSTSLRQIFDMQPRIGWVRSDMLVKLQEENARQKEQLISLRSTQDKNSNNTSTQYLEELERVKKLENEVKKRRTLMKDKEASQDSQQNMVIEIDKVSFKMVYVKGGSFVMGATSEQGEDAKNDEKPAHIVTLTNDYWIGETPVTQALWEVVMGYNPSYFARKGFCEPSRPVEQVTWNDCKEFIARLNIKLEAQCSSLDLEFCLPTEAEWEFAARGGNMSKGYKYAGSDDFDNVAWCCDKQTHLVADTKAPNELGLYDMCGNVWEWCQDRYGEYHEGEQTDPEGPEKGNRRVGRGGSSHSDSTLCRVSTRGYGNIDHAGNGLGLRLALKKK